MASIGIGGGSHSVHEREIWYAGRAVLFRNAFHQLLFRFTAGRYMTQAMGQELCAGAFSR